MDFLPVAQLEFPLVADLVRIAATVFAGAAVVASGVVILCVCEECGGFWRMARRHSRAGHGTSHLL
jgi:hypothetical protein